MKAIDLIIGISMILVVPSCTNQEVRRQLAKAESVLDSEPAIALDYLTSFPTSALTTPKDRAKYSLLYSKALDRNYIDTTDMSIIRPALDYYGEENNRDAMMSWYYAGTIEGNAGEYVPAMISFERSRTLANELSDWHYNGLSLRAQAYILNDIMDYGKAAEKCEEAISAFEKAGDTLYADYARLSKAITLKSAMRFSESKAILSEMLSRNLSSGSLFSQASRTYAECFLYQTHQQIDSALYYYTLSQTCDEPLPLRSRDLSALAQIYEQKGAIETANEIMQEAERLSMSDGFKGISHEWYLLFKHRGEYEKALNSLENSLRDQTAEISRITEQSVGYSLGVYYNQLAEKKQREIVYRSRVFGLSIAVIILIVFLLLLLMRRKRRALEKSLSDTLQVCNDIELLQERDSRLSGILEGFLNERIRSMRSIADKYFEYNNKGLEWFKEKKGVATKEELLSLFKKDLEHLRSDHSFIDTLEVTYEVATGGRFSRLRNTVSEFEKKEHKRTPLLKKEDYDILICYFCGFPVKTISFLSAIPDYVISERLYRYRAKLSFLPEEDYKEFFQKHTIPKM